MNADPDAFTPSSPAAPPAPPRSPWRVARSVAIFLVVAWHLVFFAIRNPLDLWKDEIRGYLEKKVGWEEGGERAFDIADLATKHFAHLSGCEQRWVMFSPPMARKSGFLGTRLEFSDGSTVTIPSDNEPTPERFFRVGGWQTRKLEDSLMKTPPQDEELPMWSAFVRAKAKAWKALHPDDPRELARIVLVERTIHFPSWDKPVGVYRAPEETDLGSFDPDGRLLP